MFRQAAFALFLLTGGSVGAAEFPPAMSQYIYDDLMRWINHPQIVAGVTSPDVLPVPMTHEGDVVPALSTFLNQHLQQSDGRIIAVQIVDLQGIAVARAGQGAPQISRDPATFDKILAGGSGAVVIEPLKQDAVTREMRGQVTFAVTDPDSGAVVGAISVGLAAAAFY